jgi:hypothetical protein
VAQRRPQRNELAPIAAGPEGGVQRSHAPTVPATYDVPSRQ